jgi:hypothetical protein
MKVCCAEGGGYVPSSLQWRPFLFLGRTPDRGTVRRQGVLEKHPGSLREKRGYLGRARPTKNIYVLSPVLYIFWCPS